MIIQVAGRASFSSELLNFFRHFQDLEQGDGVVQSTH